MSIEIMGTAVVTLLVTTVGGIIVHHYAIYADTKRRRKDAPDWIQNTMWASTWQTNENNIGWTKDDVNIKVEKGRCVLENKNNPNDYEFVCEGDFAGTNILVGKYRSKRNKKSKGAFVLCLVKPYIVGFFLGPAQDNNNNFGAWVMAKTENELDDAKHALLLRAPGLSGIF